MRNEHSMTLVAIVVMLCCMGSTTGAFPATQQNTIIARVIVEAYPSISPETSLASLEAPEQTSACILFWDITEQIEIEELHNLPPPSLG